MNTSTKDLLIATHNKNKIKEITEILTKHPIRFRYLSEYNNTPQVNENGSSFQENALIKARTFNHALNIPVIAEDSGLVIPAINGEPGIYSARYGSKDGEKVDDEKLIKRVLEKMKHVPQGSRHAQFISVCVLMINTTQIFIAQGELQGTITFKKSGNNGFGYDPIFLIPQMNKTLAQLNPKEKNKLSHRNKALNIIENKIELIFF